MVVSEKVINVKGRAYYNIIMFMLSYGLEGMAINCLSVACRNSCDFQGMLQLPSVLMYLSPSFLREDML